MKHFDVAIIGSGSAGSMAALRSILYNHQVLNLMGGPKAKKKARATWVNKVENMPLSFDTTKAIVRTSAQVYKWIEGQENWKDNLTKLPESASKIEGKPGNFTLTTHKNKTFTAKYVVICTGVMDIQPEIDGAIDPIFPFANNGHVDYCIRCDGHKAYKKDTVIIGHTSTAAWVALLIMERYFCPSMQILTNGHDFEWGQDKEVLEKRLTHYSIKIQTSPIQSIMGEPKISLKGFQLKNGTSIPCQMSYVSLGIIVYNELAKSLGCQLDSNGYVLTDESGETDVPGVFVAGDLRANKKNQIYTAWDTAVDSLDKIDRYLRTERRATGL